MFSWRQRLKANRLGYLVKRAGYLISDDSRYSYRMSDYSDIKA
jgi:hypothetical protein